MLKQILGEIGNSLKVALSIKQKPVTAWMGVERDFDFTLKWVGVKSLMIA